MVRQSRLPAVLLTRPTAQGDRFAAMLRDRFGTGLRIVASPLIAPTFLDDPVPAACFAAVILTSETGVEAAARRMADLPHEAWCVGDRTAQAATAAGFLARSAQGDGADLVRAVLRACQSGPLLHLRGRESRGDIAAMLTLAGLPTRDLVVYEQRPQPLTTGAAGLLSGSDTVVAPVFSPRTARLLSVERDRLALTAPLRLVPLSQAVSAAFLRRPDDAAWVASRPDANAMLDAMADAFGMA